MDCGSDAQDSCVAESYKTPSGDDASDFGSYICAQLVSGAVVCMLNDEDTDFSSIAIDINGKELVLFGENTINDVVCSYVLNNLNVTPVTKTYLGSTQLTQQGLLSDDGGKVYLVAEDRKSVV